ncbi:PLP-dependent aminotransferase family protein [Rhodoferax aquaticus]|uniref:PLP-dependent aminotransferase family protein n=1 Tax=Rhodoferax aquaticus TaxID=2527691 RepID=A0A515EK86_9BURK|nr:PLP-dependent aminotransferase family protein [Rhodoferax aquaticus]QDL53077.1 PLP-dependent aminotransferase family protein [Rhodoferax aquaticus]
MTDAHVWLSMFHDAQSPARGLRERVCATVRQAIRVGSLPLGARLPASRVLAQDLSVSRVTVEAAYTQLEAEGYLVRRTGQGSFVAIDLASGNGQQHQSSTTNAGLTEQVALSQRGQRTVGTGGCQEPMRLQAFAAGSPDLRAFPNALWRQLTNQQLRQGSDALMRYGDPQGLPALREAIAHYLAQSRAVRCSADQVLVLTSSQQALQLIAHMLIDAGDVVWMEDPGYRGARAAFASAGANIVAMPVDSEGMVCNFEQPTPRLIYLTPSHQYPTGHTLSLARRNALLDYAQRVGAWIVEDDYDSEFIYDKRPTPSMQGLDRHDRVVYVGTFSKALFPSLRLAYTVLPHALVAPLVTARTVYDGHVAQLPQAVTAEFMLRGHFSAHLRLMRQLYRSRRDVLLDCLAEKLPWAQALNPAGGLQLGVALPKGREVQLTRQAAALGIATPSLGALYQTAGQVDGWLLGFAALQPEEIKAAVDALAHITP